LRPKSFCKKGRATPLSVAHFILELFMSIESRIVKYLSKTDGYNTLTANQMRSKFGVKNPSAMVDTLRKKGYSIYRNSKKVSGSKVSFYRLGKPTKEIIAAGIMALRSKGINAFA
jgi:predicted transcriptional regulator|tara:strand:+ start:347 stop:691 length:345 start_codon:yes stop_codon:yes gene_type:complete